MGDSAVMQDIAVADGSISIRMLHMGDAAIAPLVCLHPAPFDGSYFSEFAKLLDRKRTVVAPDYPGHGASSMPATPPRIDDYAMTLNAALAQLYPAQPLHLLGFHTGCLVACEMALQSAQVQQLVLIDIPCFAGAEQEDKFRANFIADDHSTWGFGAAFSYPCDERLPRVTNATLVIATGSDLQNATRHAANLLSRSQFEECADITRPAFKNGGARFAELVAGFLRS